MTLPSILLIPCALSGLAGAMLFLRIRPDRTALSETLEKLPRARIPGWILSAIVVFWCVPHVQAVLDADSAFQPWIIPGSLLLLILCCIWLDCLFARAFAAFLILAAHGLLRELQPAFPPAYPLLAALLLFAGLCGIFLAAKPHWMRDLFRLAVRRSSVRWTCVGYFSLLTLTSLICFVGMILS